MPPDVSSRSGFTSSVESATVHPVPDESATSTWSENLSAVVGQRVQRYRKARGLTGQELSAALAELGIQLKRNVLGNLESGYRRTVSLPEVLALAYVLGVPPVLLMLPVGADEDVEALPGMTTHTWDAARWVTGEGGPPGDRGPVQPLDAREAAWRLNVDLLTLYREHDAKLRDWRSQTHIGVVGDSAEQVDRLFERALARRNEIEAALRLVRRAIRGRGDLPPPLPQELAHIDKEWSADG